MQSRITGSFWAKILIIANVSSICDTHSIPNTSCVSIYLSPHDNWMGWSRYDYLSHCRSEKESGRSVETVAFCLLVSRHRLDWGGRRWVNLSLMAWRLHFWVGENRKSIKQWWLQFTHMQHELMFIFSHGSLFSDIGESMKAAASTTGLLRRANARSWEQKSHSESQSCLISMQYFISSYNYKFDCFTWFHSELKSRGREAVKIYPRLFLVRAKYLNEAN